MRFVSRTLDHLPSKFLEASRDAFLTQHVKEPTRYRQGQTSNILDLVLTDEEEQIKSVDIVPPPLGKSDHAAVLLEVLCNHSPPVNKKIKFKYFKGNYPAINENLMSVDWESLLTDKSVDECWRTLRNKLEELCKEHIPQSSTKKNSRN